MGCRFSCAASEPACGVRVITINGHVEHFQPPITAGEVSGKPPRHVLCSAGHLLSAGTGPLRPEDRLEPGRLYFLLPASVLQAGPLELAGLATRLTTLARSASSVRAKAISVDLVGPEGSDTTADGKGNQRPRPGTWQPVLSTVREVSLSRSTASESTPTRSKSLSL
ncbi:hypothetical protein HPP92_016517 [Vanilla planifolia]|uniref:Uncharacterized protein n=1 Tax=Vanilla planifolia TaxID=51239 RepID=A0A835UU99_VANPL|nr:hypothetical protein HPP92_017115 [Vanilla planifolia]KAG0471971.1 hypothetical protein HPP92_016517 [Vanilla planifolia]